MMRVADHVFRSKTALWRFVLVRDDSGGVYLAVYINPFASTRWEEITRIRVGESFDLDLFCDALWCRVRQNRPVDLCEVVREAEVQSREMESS